MLYYCVSLFTGMQSYRVPVFMMLTFFPLFYFFTPVRLVFISERLRKPGNSTFCSLEADLANSLFKESMTAV